MGTSWEEFFNYKESMKLPENLFSFSSVEEEGKALDFSIGGTIFGGSIGGSFIGVSSFCCLENSFSSLLLFVNLSSKIPLFKF